MLDGLPVAELWLPAGAGDEPGFAELRERAEARGVLLRERGAGDGLTPPPRVSLGGIGQVLGLDILDQVTFFDCSLSFDCFRVVDLLALSSGFVGVPGAPGYLQLTAQPVGAGGSDVHDQAYGDGNGMRRRPVLGWALERRAGATSARLLDSLPIPLAPFLADEEPVFDTEVGS